MATLLTIPQKLAIAQINEYLITNGILKKGLFGDGINNWLASKIRMIRESVTYRYNLNPADTSLEPTSNYLLGMCLYISSARCVEGVIAGVTGVATMPTPYQFMVDGSTSFILDGESSKTITAFVGFNLIFTRNGVPQSIVNDGSGSYYSWTKATGSFVCYPAAASGEIFGLFPI